VGPFRPNGNPYPRDRYGPAGLPGRGEAGYNLGYGGKPYPGGHPTGHGGFGGTRAGPNAGGLPIPLGAPRGSGVARPPPGLGNPGRFGVRLPPGYESGPDRFGGRGPPRGPSQGSSIGTQRPPRPRPRGPPISGAQRPGRDGEFRAGSLQSRDSISRAGSRASSARHPRGRSGLSDYDR